jgi:hypothetical protein
MIPMVGDVIEALNGLPVCDKLAVTLKQIADPLHDHIQVGHIQEVGHMWSLGEYQKTESSAGCLHLRSSILSRPRHGTKAVIDS